jgi:hypothetical protein
MIWQFGERGYDYSIDYNGRLGEKPPRWDYLYDWRRSYLYRQASALIKLRQEYDAFRTDDFELQLIGSMKKIILRHESMDVVILGNFRTSDQTIDPTFTHTGDWYEYFTGEKLTVADVNEWLLLDPGEYRIYTDLQLPVPDIGTGLVEPGQLFGENDVILYPNPCSGAAHLRYLIYDSGYLISDLYSISGVKIRELTHQHLKPGEYEFVVDLSDLPAGMYFIRTQSGKSISTTKLIISH